MNIILNLKEIPNQPPEGYYGNKEYKISLLFKKVKSSITLEKIFEKKASQMLFRIVEGGGKAIYLIGITDSGIAMGISFDDLLDSIKNFKKISDKINANIKVIRIYKGIEGYIASIRIFIKKDILKNMNIFELNI